SPLPRPAGAGRRLPVRSSTLNLGRRSSSWGRNAASQGTMSGVPDWPNAARTEGYTEESVVGRHRTPAHVLPARTGAPWLAYADRARVAAGHCGGGPAGGVRGDRPRPLPRRG